MKTAPEEPIALVVAGRVGSGKSALAKALGGELGWEVFSSDRTRKQLAGVPLYVRGEAAVRGRLYAEAMTKRTYAALFQRARGQLKERRSVILEATFGRRFYRDRLKAQLKRAGVTCRFVETQASEAIRRRRLKEREGQRDEVSDARLEDFETIDRSYEAPSELGPHGLIGLNTARPLEATVTKALEALAQRAAQGVTGRS